MYFKVKLRGLILFFIFLIPIYMGAFFFNGLCKERIKVNLKIIKPTARILILGDSHSANGINPDVLGRSVNLSDYGESYIQDYFKLKFVLSKKNSIRTVILPVDLHSLNNHRNNAILFIGYWDRFIDFIELGKYKKKEIKYWIYKYIDINLFDFRGEYITLFNAISKKLKHKNPGFINKFKGIKNQYFHRDRERKGESRALHHFLGRKWINNEMIFYLKKIINLCKSRKLNLVLIKMPVSIQYYKCAEKMVPVKRYYNMVNKIIKYKPRVYLLDLHNIFFNKERWKFYDSEHLNDDGAKIFSNILKKELIKRGLY